MVFLALDNKLKKAHPSTSSNPNIKKNNKMSEEVKYSQLGLV